MKESKEYNSILKHNKKCKISKLAGQHLYGQMQGDVLKQDFSLEDLKSIMLAEEQAEDISGLVDSNITSDDEINIYSSHCRFEFSVTYS